MNYPDSIADLPVTPEGIPVTYTVAWEGELRAFIDQDSELGRVVNQIDSPGLGKPRLKLTHVGRQRKCVREGLCQVCGLPVGDRRWIADFRIHATDRLRVGKGDFRPLLIDAWTCDQCIGFSLATCPALLRKRQDPAWRIFRVADWVEVPTPERPTWIPSTIPFGPVGYVKVAPLEFIAFSPHYWDAP